MGVDPGKAGGWQETWTARPEAGGVPSGAPLARVS